MAIFIQNVNGDWWEYRPGQALYILNTDDLPAEEQEDWETNGQMEGVWIAEYGKEVIHDIVLPETPKVWYTDEELDAEVDEIIEAEFNEAYNETMEELSEELGISEETLRDSKAVDEIVTSYIEDNVTYAQMVNKVYTATRGETF